MKKSTRKILWGLFLALAVVIAVILFTTMRPPVHLEVVSHSPSKHIQFANSTGREMNFFFFTEVKSNGTWVASQRQPKGAREAKNVKPHAVREFEIAPAPVEAAPWRVGFSYQAAMAPWYLEWTKRLGVLKNHRTHYFDFKTEYMEFTQ